MGITMFGETTQPQTGRSFSVEQQDARIPVLLHTIRVCLLVVRISGHEPVAIWLSADVYTAIAAYMGSCTIDRLFTLPVQANLSSDAQPFTIAWE